MRANRRRCSVARGVSCVCGCNLRALWVCLSSVHVRIYGRACAGKPGVAYTSRKGGASEPAGRSGVARARLGAPQQRCGRVLALIFT